VRPEPFEAVVARHGPTVLRVCRAVLGPAAADDAWSETFLSAMRAYPALRADSDVGAWLVTIAHRKAIDQLRARARRPVPIDVLPEADGASARYGGPTRPRQPGGEESDLWAALKELPLRQRECIAFHYLAGLPYAEFAAVLGGTAAAARRAAADGIANLRRGYLADDLSLLEGRIR
jgi:RNA polymerase sigma factor (sigma-70 family)